MTYENLLLGVAIHLLFYDHLPHWGTWFKRILAMLPTPLQTLYEQWRCPYCAGFWIGLALHALTGQWFLPIFAELPGFWGAASLPIGWFFDGLAFAVMNKLAVLVINAISYPALLTMAKKKEILGD